MTRLQSRFGSQYNYEACWPCRPTGAGIFFGRGERSKIKKKRNIRKKKKRKKKVSKNCDPPLYWQQKIMIPSTTNTPYPLKQAKVISKLVFLNYGHLVTPYILVIKDFMTPYVSFQNFMTPVYLGQLLPKKMPAPYN